MTEKPTKENKKKNPVFMRQDAFNIKSLKLAWRKPRGIHSKMRMSIKGHRKLVKIGHRNPYEIRNTHNQLKIVRVHNLHDLEKINPEQEIIIISSSIGFKKKQLLLERAKEANIKILNIKNPDTYLSKIREERAKKKTKIKKSMERKEEKKEEKREEKTSSKKQQEKLSEKEAKEKQEQEKRKILEGKMQ